MTKPVDKDSLPLDKPRRTPGHPTKSHVVKTNVDGREKIIRFGEQGAETAGKPKAGESDRMKQKRASFKARHAQNIAKGKSSPAYWANKVKWNEGGAVKMAAGGSAALALIEQMRRSGAQSQEFDPVLVAMREQRARPARRPQMPAQAPAPLTAMRAPQPREEPLPLPPVPPAMRPDENPPPEAPPNPMRFDEGNPLVAHAVSMAQRYNLPPSIFLSLIQQESRFNPTAVSSRGAIGLGQLMPATARELNVDPRDPMQNLEGSARYLRQMLDRFGTMELALAAYNAGPGRVRQAGNTIPNIRETREYVPSVLRRAGASTGPEYAEGGEVKLDDESIVDVPEYAAFLTARDYLRELARSDLEKLPALSAFANYDRRRGTTVVPYGVNVRTNVPITLEGDMLDVGGGYQGVDVRGRNFRRNLNLLREAGAGYTMPDGGRLSLDYYDRMTGDMGEGGRPDELHQDVRSLSDAEMRGRPVPSRGVRLGYRREFAEGGLADLDQKYAEGGEVMSDEEYDRRLLSRMKAQTGRVTEPTRAEQMQALRTAGRDAAELAADVLLPQSPLDFALMAAFGPGGRAARLAGSAALASLEPSEAEASRLRRLIRAYHGSPHKFDEFDIRKIGTGEGAQAYGKGLYFAEDEDIARWYRDKLSKDLFTTPEGSLWSPYSLKHLNLRAVAAKNPDDLNVAIRRGEDFIDRMPPATRDLVESDLGVLRSLRDAGGVSRNPGHMYEVNLNAAPSDFLNWDIPLSEQSRGVQDSAARAWLTGDFARRTGNPQIPIEDLLQTEGGALVRMMDEVDPEETRLALMRAGIPGTRYLDAGSRGVGGTYNYAVFDPEIIDITRRYAEGGLAQLDQKYAEGGVVRSEAATYDPDAVDALVKQIEAEYV